jgi:predicted CXXCH cytochrome family protein
MGDAMNRISASPGRVSVSLITLAILGLGPISAAEAQLAADIVNTKHNLSVSGPGPIRALTETRICIFCHTPHNAAPLSALWNKDIEPQVYTVYASPTLKAGPLPQPSGPTKLCLSCHDGTIAMGAVLNPAGGVSMAGGDRFAPGSLSNFGLDLSGHHPVSFPYHDALPNIELASSPPPDLVYGGQDEVHCITCHDPHKDAYGMFLLKDNRYSALCTTCHQMTGWSASAHATSTASVVGILPRPPKTWPTYTQLNEWGCEACHTPHFAPTAEELLNFTSAPPDPFSCTSAGCHSSAPPGIHAATAASTVAYGAVIGRSPGETVDIARLSRKPSAHHESPTSIIQMSQLLGGAQRSGIRSVTCADCHNPHVTNAGKAQAPYASGMLQGVSGIDRNGAAVRSVTYEYEVCLKCHGDNTPDLNYIPRVVVQTNLRLAFDPANPSYHPVLNMGKNLNIPSIPSPFEPSMNPSVVIYCSTCHADDEEGSRGPHGSSFPPILKARYDTADYTQESFDHYALCYRCHNQASILSDQSFKGHRRHLQAGAPCSACHDAHGVNALMGTGSTGTGSHTHLINFDTRIALPYELQYPVYTDRGTFSGSCDLCCHNVAHATDSTTCGATAALKIGAPKAVAPSVVMPKVAAPNVGAPLAVAPPGAVPHAAVTNTTGACTPTMTVCGSYGSP